MFPRSRRYTINKFHPTEKSRMKQTTSSYSSKLTENPPTLFAYSKPLCILFSESRGIGQRKWNLAATVRSGCRAGIFGATFCMARWKPQRRGLWNKRYPMEPLIDVFSRSSLSLSLFPPRSIPRLPVIRIPWQLYPGIACSSSERAKYGAPLYLPARRIVSR